MAHGARLVSLLAGVMAASVVALSPIRRRVSWGVAVGVLVVRPMLAVAAMPALGIWAGHSRLRQRRSNRTDISADVTVLAEVVGLGLSAGLTLSQALGAARRHVHPELAGEVDGLLRRAAAGGLAQALSTAEGHGRRLYAMTARAVVTGAPLAPAVDSFVREAVAEHRSRRHEAARRLPVRMMLPLALLILPGFVLLTVGPTVLAALERFVLTG